MSGLEKRTSDGHILRSKEAIKQYNDVVIDDTIKEGKRLREEAPERAEKRISEAMEGEGSGYLKSVEVGRQYFAMPELPYLKKARLAREAKERGEAS